ncbi:hypothetical protein [Solidesulfovibrio magneticus]|uniref:hypothetical protein n=1 Tax=Solidesulfovibrio magneticus TaxID=184917 RepID=UPI0011D1124E|nr:hypothetical protein [Solidesulfovibrio magneticus]
MAKEKERVSLVLALPPSVILCFFIAGRESHAAPSLGVAAVVSALVFFALYAALNVRKNPLPIGWAFIFLFWLEFSSCPFSP